MYRAFIQYERAINNGIINTNTDIEELQNGRYRGF